MKQLIVRQVEDKLVRKLKEQAGKNGVSMEEEHRRILREALLGKENGNYTLKDHLLNMPEIDAKYDKYFERDRSDFGRKVEL